MAGETVGCPAGRGHMSEGQGGSGELEKDALSWSGAQLPEAVLETSFLNAVGRELAVWGGGGVGTWKRDCSGQNKKKSTV